MGMQGLKVYVCMNICQGKNEWYCIDLDSLPESYSNLSPIVQIEKTAIGTGDWAVVDDYIYWAGGLLNVGKRNSWGGISYSRDVSAKLLRHPIITADSCKDTNWEVACPLVQLPRFNPRIFALDDNIFVLGGELRLHEYNGNDIEKLCTEVYSISNKTCEAVNSHLMDFAPGFSTENTCLVMNKEGKTKQVIFYSFYASYLLFYNVRQHTFRLQLHPDFASGLFTAAMNAKPVVRNSTLYWFTNDLCLYGYDFVQRRWFQSQVLETKDLWELPPDFSPILVDLYNGEFLVLARTLSGKLGMAILDVFRPKPIPKPNPYCKFTEFFKVTVKSCHTFSLLTGFTLINAMAVNTVSRRCSTCCRYIPRAQDLMKHRADCHVDESLDQEVQVDVLFNLL